MKLLYGTGNAAKVSVMRQRLSGLDLEIVSLQDLEAEGKALPEIAEDGASLLENAKEKALAYYRAFQVPVFSCDSGLYIEGIPEEEQPGIHVRRVRGKCLTDEEMMQYYSGLAKKYGDLRARYRSAICLVLDEEHVHPAMEENMASHPFLITSRPHRDGIRKKGFPLDCLSVDISTGKYYYDMDDAQMEQLEVETGFLEFLQKYLDG